METSGDVQLFVSYPCANLSSKINIDKERWHVSVLNSRTLTGTSRLLKVAKLMKTAQSARNSLHYDVS